LYAADSALTRRHVRLIFCLTLFVTLAFISTPGRASAEKMKVVAGIAPLADFARQVGGDKVSVILLLPPGASPHTYEPTPGIFGEIASAKVFIKVGHGFESWADRLIAAANPGIITVDCSEGVDLLRLGGDDRKTDITAYSADPHIWLDPLICITIIEKIREAFSEIDPADADFYKKNAGSYIEKLRELDKEIEEAVRDFKTKKFVTFHPAWNYFARRYGLKVIGVIEEGPGREPTAKHLGELLDKLKTLDTRIVFAEPQFSPRTAEAIAREAGAKVVILDPVGGQKGRETYLKTMRYDLSKMKEAME
jgi:zinc transport system substrate-binding protein